MKDADEYLDFHKTKYARFYDEGDANDVLDSFSEKDTKKKSILIVDDEPNIVNLIKFNLRKYYDIQTAYSGREAIEVAKKIKPEFITMDVMMPSLDGLSVTKMLKENPETKDIPVIIISAKVSNQDKLDALDSGADNYLVKPFTSKELKDIIKDTINVDLDKL